MVMHNSPHPGEVLTELYIEPLREEQGLTITELAKALDVRRQTLSELIHQKTGISPKMAIRLSIVFNTTPDLWMNLQSHYDLWLASKDKRLSKKLKPLVVKEKSA